MNDDDYKRALVDPSDVFEAPEEVRDHVSLSREQKIEILRRWEYNAAEEDVALEEGMPGNETGLLRRIMVALGTLADGIDVGQTPPSKQHGLPKSAVKPRE